MEKFNFRKAARDFNVDPKTIKDWRSKKSLFLNCPNKITKFTLHSGRNPDTNKEEEEDILNFIKYNRKLGFSVDSNQIIIRL